MPLSKINILCTGSIDGSLVSKAADQDILIDVIPFITTTPIPPAEMELRVKPILEGHATVIFTSGNAVESVSTCLDGQTPDWSVYCIGYNTKRLIERYFGASAITDVAENAASLALKIKSRHVEEEVIFFCGDQRRQELPDILEMSGTIVKEVVVYRTTPSPVKVEKNYEGILFFSPSAVQSYLSLNAIHPGTVLFVIGATTSKALAARTENTIVQSDTPEKEMLITKMIDYFK